MTISSTVNRVQFNGNGSTTAFPFTFKVFDQADITVVVTDADDIETTQVITTDYTVSLNADQNNNPGGTVTMITAPVSGETLTVVREIDALQETDITNGGGFYPEVIENALDRVTMLAQQLAEANTRQFTLPVSVSGVSAEVPFPEANKLVAWNDDATALQNIDSQTLATVVAFGTANADIFDGDGSTTAFVLSDNPGALNNLDVSISGVTKTPGVDYTWTSGTTLTFTAAPASGTGNILVRYMQGLPQGHTDADLVSYTPAGTGAQVTNVQSKLREFVSVKDFGAVGDGVTDDTAAIQAAIDHLVGTSIGGELVFPSATYKCLSGLVIDASIITIVGKSSTLDFSSFAASTGAAITLTGAATGSPYYNGSNQIQGLKIIGPGQAILGNTGVLFTGSDDTLGANDYALREVSIYGFTTGIVLGNIAYHLLFDHCTVFQCAVAVSGELFPNSGARNVFHRCTIANSDYGFVLQNSSSGSTDITDCVLAGIRLVVILIHGGHLSVTNCDIEPGNSHPANYRTLWVTDDSFPSYSYINWHGNQVSVKNATNVPIYGIDGACVLTITGGYLYSNPAGTGGVFGSVGTGAGELATFNWTADYGTNPQLNFNGAGIDTYIHTSNNRIVAPDTDVTFSDITGSTFATSNLASGLTVSDNSVTADGTDATIDINLVPKGATGKVVAPIINSTSPDYISVPSGVATTVHTLANINGIAAYLVTVGSVQASAIYSGSALIMTDNGSARVSLSGNGAQCAITVSGLDVQVTQTSGGAKTYRTSVLRVQ